MAKLMLVATGFLATVQAQAEPPCRPFRVHLHADLPAPPPPGSAAATDLKACIAYYEKMDLNHNGVPDWTANVDGQISDVLFPNDDDMDGDGVPNVLDPEPLNPKVSKSKSAKNGVPEHLALQGEVGRLQGEIYRRYGIIAIDHTDHHSAAVLRAVELVLGKGLSREARKRIKSVKYIYAFEGHDASDNIAAYHRQAHALSIGGVSAYGDAENLSPDRRIALASSIAHELGHAFLFDQMSAAELGRIGEKFGDWKSVLAGDEEASDAKKAAKKDFLDHSFFRSHPLRELARLAGQNQAEAMEFISRPVWRKANLVSEYATTNIHEWFADAFAAALMQRLGETGALGGGWKQRLARLPPHADAYWVNYNNLSPAFRTWIDQRLSPGRRAQPASTVAHREN